MRMTHHGSGLGPTGYKAVARLIAPASGLSSDRHPDRSKRGINAAVNSRGLRHVPLGSSIRKVTPICRALEGVTIPESGP